MDAGSPEATRAGRPVTASYPRLHVTAAASLAVVGPCGWIPCWALRQDQCAAGEKPLRLEQVAGTRPPAAPGVLPELPASERPAARIGVVRLGDPWTPPSPDPGSPASVSL